MVPEVDEVWDDDMALVVDDEVWEEDMVRVVDVVWGDDMALVDNVVLDGVDDEVLVYRSVLEDDIRA